MHKKNDNDRSRPPCGREEIVGRVSAEGRIHDFGASWRWVREIEDIRDLVAPTHQSRIDDALTAASRDGSSEVEALFRGATVSFRWRFERNDDRLLQVSATAPGFPAAIGELAADAPAGLDGDAREFAASRTALLKKIARGDELVTILYELIGTIEQYRSRLTAAVLDLHAGHLQVQAAPGLDNGCIQAMHALPPSEVGGAIRAAVVADPTTGVSPSHDNGASLAHAMTEAGYGEVVARPVRNLSGAVLGVLAVFVAERSDADEEVAEILEEMAQIASIAFEQHAMKGQLLRQAYYDPLTHLPNRTLLNDRLDQLILDAGRGGSAIGVMMLDLDEFKLVNDTFGHAAGDSLLQQVATRLEGCLRASDTVARFGGDEFVIITPLSQAGRATDIAQRVIEALQASFSVKQRSVDARPSIGISLFPQDARSTEGLLQAADTAMYAAKMAGKNRYHYFSESMNAEVSRRLRIEGELREALAKDELVLHFQPVVALADESVVGAEALIRWQHPEHGLLLPEAFLPVAEQSELVNAIDCYVLEHAMKQVAAWQQSGHDLLMSLIITSLNISARGLHEEEFAARVGRILRDSGIDPRFIELEITESMIMRDFQAAVAQLLDLKEGAPGLRIAIDDFGTGHASFAYLRELPVDTLKIDMSFVADLDKPKIAHTARAIIKAIVALGRNLGLTVVAEGVETRAQADFLRAVGCQRAQGYLFAYPLDVESFEAFVR